MKCIPVHTSPGQFYRGTLKLWRKKQLCFIKKQILLYFVILTNITAIFAPLPVNILLLFWRTEQTVFLVYLSILFPCVDIVKYYVDEASSPVSKAGWTHIVYNCRRDSSVSAKQCPWEENCPRVRTKFDVLIGGSGYPHKKRNTTLYSNKQD